MSKIMLQSTVRCVIVWMIASIVLADVDVSFPSASTADMITNASMETERAADATLRKEIKNRGVTKEKVAPTKILNGKPKVELAASLSVVSVLSVDNARQTIYTAAYVELTWQDLSLAWNASEHSGVKEVELPIDAVWTPDLQIINSYEQMHVLNGVRHLTLDSSGHLLVKTPLLTKTACVMDLTYYPFDQQVCEIMFYSLTKYVSVTASVDELQSAVWASSLGFGNEWDLINVTIQLFRLQPDDNVFPNLILTLKRKTTFYVVCLVVPMVLTSYMNTLVFLLPLESEKVSFLVSIFVSSSIFFSYFTDVLPRGLDNVPNLIQLLLGVAVQCFVFLLCVIVALKRHQHQQQSDRAASPQRRCDAHKNDIQNDLLDTEAKSENNMDTNSDLSGKVRCVKGNEVHPVNVQQGQQKIQTESATTAGDGHDSVRAKASLCSPDTRQLDQMLFVVSFIGTTVFLLTLFCSSKP